MIGSKINFKPEFTTNSQYHPGHHPQETPKDFNFSMAKSTVKGDLALFGSPKHEKVNEMFQSMGPSNPYNTKWFRKVLRNQFDVDLIPVDPAAFNSTNVKWKVKKVKHDKKPSRPSHEEGEDFGHHEYPNRDYISSQYSARNAESQFFGSNRTSMKVVSQPGTQRGQQPALNNFVQKVKKKFIFSGFQYIE